MNRVLPTIPISDLRFHQSALLDQLGNAPVVLTRQGRAVAVLVDPGQWNQLAEELDDLADALAVAQSRLDRTLEEEELLDWEDVKTELAEIGSNAVQS